MAIFLLLLAVFSAKIFWMGVSTLSNIGTLLSPPNWLVWFGLVALLTWLSGEG